MGLSALSAYRGDIVQAQAACAAGIPMILSGTSLIRLEDVIAAAPGTWFKPTCPAIRRASTRCSTASPRPLSNARRHGRRSCRRQSIQQHARGIFDAAASLVAPGYDGLSHPRWLLGTFVRTLLRHGMPHFENRSPNAALR